MFVRNPHFRSRSPEARPAGFADRIVVASRRSDAVERDIAAVQRGTADVAIIANPFRSHVSPGRLRALETRSPRQLHSAPVPTTDWRFLNVTRRPFDDLGVRQAVKLATDRAGIVKLAGGPQLAMPTCQIIPTAFPGHEPYCPYTANPGRGRDGGGRHPMWHAPGG